MGSLLLGKKIVIVEDDSNLSAIFKKIIYNEGANVYTSYDGEAGLQICSKLKPDLIITDVNMPKMTGLEMIEGLKSFDETKYIPFIVMTAGAVDTQVHEAIRLGASGYLVKPFKSKDLLAKVLQVLCSK